MRRGWLLAIGLALLMAAALTALAAKEEGGKSMGKGKEVTVMGEFACAFCKVAHPDHACAMERCQTCLKAGSPTMLTDAKGKHVPADEQPVRTGFDE